MYWISVCEQIWLSLNSWSLDKMSNLLGLFQQVKYMKNLLFWSWRNMSPRSWYISTNKREIHVFLQSARVLYILMIKYLHLSKPETTWMIPARGTCYPFSKSSSEMLLKSASLFGCSTRLLNQSSNHYTEEQTKPSKKRIVLKMAQYGHDRRISSRKTS